MCTRYSTSRKPYKYGSLHIHRFLPAARSTAVPTTTRQCHSSRTRPFRHSAHRSGQLHRGGAASARPGEQRSGAPVVMFKNSARAACAHATAPPLRHVWPSVQRRLQRWRACAWVTLGAHLPGNYRAPTVACARPPAQLSSPASYLSCTRSVRQSPAPRSLPAAQAANDSSSGVHALCSSGHHAGAHALGIRLMPYSSLAAGSKPLQIWKEEVNNGHCKRITDNDIQSSVLEIMSTNISTTYVTCPAKPTHTLGIKLPFLVMIIKNVCAAPAHSEHVPATLSSCCAGAPAATLLARAASADR